MYVIIICNYVECADGHYTILLCRYNIDIDIDHVFRTSKPWPTGEQGNMMWSRQCLESLGQNIMCHCRSGDSWMYPYQRTPLGNPYISPSVPWVVLRFMLSYYFFCLGGRGTRDGLMVFASRQTKFETKFERTGNTWEQRTGDGLGMMFNSNSIHQ